jgi:hypothetical protein
MTRAVWKALGGDLAGSFAMHPLAIPTMLAIAALAIVTIGVTLTRGSPTALLEVRSGRVAFAAFVVLEALAIALWVARMAGAFGGPVPV